MSEDRQGLWSRVAARTRNLFQEGFRGLGSPLAPDFYESLEELLIAGDLGPANAVHLTEAVNRQRPRTLAEVQAALEEEVVAMLSTAPRTLNLGSIPAVVLVSGINGAGKTTTIGKLAHGLKSSGRRPLVVAADTFRAAGIEQMLAWADRAGVDSFAGKAGGDAAAAAFDGIQAARSRGHDTVLIDTAGRLQTQHNLIEELKKVNRVVGKALEGAPHESLLVLDSSLGQNSLVQARVFHRALDLTGLVLAKMDGTAKGGAVIAIETELQVPAKLMGLGGKITDLYAFDPRWFARTLFAPTIGS